MFHPAGRGSTNQLSLASNRGLILAPLKQAQWLRNGVSPERQNHDVLLQGFPCLIKCSSNREQYRYIMRDSVDEREFSNQAAINRDRAETREVDLLVL
jgi:hypothetical protein